MRKYTTISVPVEVKELLKREKGDMEWGEWLLKLRDERSKRAFEALAKGVLTSGDLEAAVASSKRFRREFRFR
ncbi:MAG: hypothetical protein QMD00_02145 [Hadesarchaea archaeon]|nr:hypothetical protein [Hadesarchaea archaeon]